MSKKDEVVIRVSNVAKDFYLPHEKSNSIKTKIVRMFDKKQKGGDTQHALKDISFEVKKGEFFGIVGRNGSGKSTLLKIISQIYKPTKGSVTVNGRLVPFIELGVGFNPELTGRENVFLNGALLGFTRKEIEEQYDDIVAFAELEDFMDQKLKNYSSGMQVRLAFSVAIRARSDILILDEVLAVGDEAFQRKCNDYFYQAKKDGKTVIIVTHSMDSVRQFCDRAILINDGIIKAEGNPDKVASAYSNLFLDEISNASSQQNKKKQKPSLSDVIIDGICVMQSDKKTKTVKFKEEFVVDMDISADEDHKDLVMAAHIVDQAGRQVFRFSTRMTGYYELKKGHNKARFTIENVFNKGEYYINFAIKSKQSGNLLIQETELSPFSVVGMDDVKNDKQSIVHPDVKIETTAND